MDTGRVALLVAVLEKIVGLSLYDKDIFMNIAGGLRVVEPAVDLGAVTSIHSSLHNVSLDPSIVVVGEVGLAGEVRAVTGCEMRLKEIAKMGFKKCIVPKSNLKNLRHDGLEVVGVKSVEECLKILF
jgi:DNA repair protein RadA/Sms